MNDLPRPAMYQAFHRILPLRGGDLLTAGAYCMMSMASNYNTRPRAALAAARHRGTSCAQGTAD